MARPDIALQLTCSAGAVEAMRSYLLLAATLGVLACGSPGPDDASEARRAIEANNASVERWYASGGVDSLISLFAEDAWQMPPNHPPLTGRGAIPEFWSD